MHHNLRMAEKIVLLLTAKQRIKQFLIAAADKIGDAAAGVLQTNVEKKLLGL